MPFSWVKVPSGTSPKIRACMGDDRSKKKFEECVRFIVEKDGGRFDCLWFEQNGRWAHLNFWYDTEQQLRNILLDLEAEGMTILISADELDELIAERAMAD